MKQSVIYYLSSNSKHRIDVPSLTQIHSFSLLSILLWKVRIYLVRKKKCFLTTQNQSSIFRCRRRLTCLNNSPIRTVPKCAVLRTRKSIEINYWDWASRFEVTSLVLLRSKYKSPIFTIRMFSTLGSASNPIPKK